MDERPGLSSSSSSQSTNGSRSWAPLKTWTTSIPASYRSARSAANSPAVAALSEKSEGNRMRRTRFMSAIDLREPRARYVYFDARDGRVNVIRSRSTTFCAPARTLPEVSNIKRGPGVPHPPRRGERSAIGLGQLFDAHALVRAEWGRRWNRSLDHERQLVSIDPVVEIEPTFGPNSRQAQARDTLE